MAFRLLLPDHHMRTASKGARGVEASLFNRLGPSLTRHSPSIFDIWNYWTGLLQVGKATREQMVQKKVCIGDKVVKSSIEDKQIVQSSYVLMNCNPVDSNPPLGIVGTYNCINNFQVYNKDQRNMPGK